MSKVNVYSFDSVSAFSQYVDDAPSNKNADNSSKRTKSRGGNWDNHHSYETALAAGLDGGYWPEGAEALASVDLSSAAMELGLAPAMELELDVVGGAVDIGEYLSGAPECFYQVAEVPSVAPVVNIGVVVLPCAVITNTQLLNRGRAIMALVDAVEATGCSVALTACMGFFNDTHRHAYHIEIKRAGEHWSAATVAYALAHVGFSRRLGFKACESGTDSAAAITKDSYGWGHYRKYAPKQKEAFDIFFDYCDDGSPHDSPEQALENIIGDARKQAPDLNL